VATDDRDQPAGVAEGAPAEHNQVNGSATPEGAADDLGDAEDYEPYLPPGPNPFSSVHPQGAPPFDRTPWSPGPVSPGPELSGAGRSEDVAPEAEARAAGDGPAEPAEPAESAAPAEPAANAQAARPAVSPYPPLPDDELGAEPGGPGETAPITPAATALDASVRS